MLVQAWLKTVGYPEDCAAIPRKVINETVEYALSRVLPSESEAKLSVAAFF